MNNRPAFRLSTITQLGWGVVARTSIEVEGHQYSPRAVRTTYSFGGVLLLVND